MGKVSGPNPGSAGDITSGIRIESGKQSEDTPAGENPLQQETLWLSDGAGEGGTDSRSGRNANWIDIVAALGEVGRDETIQAAQRMLAEVEDGSRQER